MDLYEILTQLDVNYDVIEYMVIRKELLNFIAEVNGVFYDAQEAFQLHLVELQKQLKDLEKRRNEEDKFERWEEGVWYELTKLLIDNNLPQGSNLRFVGNYCIVTLFQFWEENIRPRIAQVFGVELNEINHPLFGDIRNFRNAIIHNHGFATSDVERNEIFNWYKREDLINMRKDNYTKISQAITRAIIDHQMVPEVANEVAVFLRQYKF